MDIAKDFDGHILVIPKMHCRYVTDCPENVACKVWSMVSNFLDNLEQLKEEERNGKNDTAGKAVQGQPA